ncbi:hypothetical protein EDC04DRAFT_2655242 [Pisolithus marmoratus]|nr:hypothetical protein EDC04DRAFT_2655242 [Pisolithus marmoratus]
MTLWHFDSSRARFMAATLTNPKSNKIDKKFPSGLCKKRHVQTHGPLRVSLKDSRAAETKAKC